MLKTETNTTRLLKATELAERTGKPLASIYDLTRKGEFDEFLVCIGDKPSYRYRPDGLDAYIARGGRKARTEASDERST